MNQLDAMRLYLRVAEMGSFTQAAESVGLPKASVSMAVKRLEELLGVRLLHRTTRRVRMTNDGMAYYERCKALLADMDDLQAMFQQGDADIGGRLRVDMPIGIATSIVIPRLPEFLAAHPRLTLELSSTDRRVDLVREGFDCVIRLGAMADSTMIARPLGALRIINCAAPSYLAAHGIPQNLDDLTRHRLVHYASVLGGKPLGFEYEDRGSHKIREMGGVVVVNNSEAYEAACLAGLGIIQAPEISLRGYVEDGKLVEVLTGYAAPAMPMALVYAHRHHVPKRTQRFMGWIAEIMKPYLRLDPAPLSRS